MSCVRAAAACCLWRLRTGALKPLSGKGEAWTLSRAGLRSPGIFSLGLGRRGHGAGRRLHVTGLRRRATARLEKRREACNLPPRPPDLKGVGFPLWRSGEPIGRPCVWGQWRNSRLFFDVTAGVVGVPDGGELAILRVWCTGAGVGGPCSFRLWPCRWPYDRQRGLPPIRPPHSGAC